MRRPTFLIALALVLAAGLPAVAARADGVRVLSSDARGVTLQVSADTWTLSTPGKDGRAGLTAGALAHVLADPGHALLPTYTTMLAVPLDARPSARVISAGTAQERLGVRLEIAKKQTFRPDGAGDYTPVLEVVPPVVDGLWPAASFKLGDPATFRGRRLVTLEVRPFQYDEGQARLLATPTLVVRVDFNRPAAAAALPAPSALTTATADPHADDVLAASVANFAQARSWRAVPAAGTAPTSLFARSRPARPGAAAALGFDEGRAEVRVKLDSTAMYVLPYDQLAAKGYPSGTPIAFVSVHRHEFIEGASVPYATIELPCEVDDVNHNGTFDSGDRIWLYSRTWAERSGASRPQRMWGDGEIVYVTVKPSGGLRMPQRSGWRGATGLTPLVSYPYQQHWESDLGPPMKFVPSWAPTDTSLDAFQWTLYTFYYDRPDSITFGVNDIDTLHTVRFTVGWESQAANEHFMWGAVKNPAGVLTTVADSVYWSNIGEMTSTATLTGSALGEGTNHFIDWGKANSGAPNPSTNYLANAGLNWFEAAYWRRFNAVRDQLGFNSAAASGEIQVHAAGFSSDSIRVWDVTTPDSPVRVVPDAAHTGGGAFDIQDSVATGARHLYVAAALSTSGSDGPHTPPDGNFTAVNRDPIYTHTAGDYLMVVPEPFKAAAAPLATLRSGQGLHVVVATAEQVYDEFNGGRHSADAIKRFVKYAYNNWSARFLLLVGDGTQDPLNHFGNAGADWIPVINVGGPVAVGGAGMEITVSDNLYGIVTGNANPGASPGYVIPEIMVGRLPANSAADVTNMVDKIVGYENMSGDQSWREHSIMLADDAYSTGLDFGGGSSTQTVYTIGEENFRGLNDKARSVIAVEAGLSQLNVEPFNLRYYIPTSFNPDSTRLRSAVQSYVHSMVTPVLFSHMNAGAMWVNFQGHANENVLTHEDLYMNYGDNSTNDDRFLFSNPGKPIFFSAFSCHANMFARPGGAPSTALNMLGGCIGEDMVTHAGGGAVASWASTCYEAVPGNAYSHLSVELARALFSSPPRDSLVSGGSARVVLGEAILAAFMRYVPTVAWDSEQDGTAITYTLLGDPAQRMSIGHPELSVFANDTAVVDTRPVRLHTPGDSLRLVANLASTVQIDSVALLINEGSGDTPVTLDPAYFSPVFPDTAGGGKYGGRRFQLTYRTLLKPETYHYRLVTRDLNGLTNNLTVQFQYEATLRVNGIPIHDGDAVAPNANLSMMLVSPAPIDAHTQLTLTLNGKSVPVDATPAPGDASGREWIVSWSHGDYPSDNYAASLVLAGGPTIVRTFHVTTGALKLADMFAFPNPFDNDGTRFSFILLGSDPADVRITVFTISGKRIVSTDYRGLMPGYHQLPWDGHDAEGSEIANGTYFYRLSATTASGQHIAETGRMVKLRKPRHVDIVATP